MTRRSGLRRLLHLAHLLVSAWRLHSRAQLLAGGGSWAATRARMLATRGLPVGASPEDALWAAGWAARVARRLPGRLDSCLVRSLVAGSLVADTPEVTVRIGFHRPRPSGDLMDGHAWLSVQDRVVTAPREASPAAFEEVFALPLERPR